MYDDFFVKLNIRRSPFSNAVNRRFEKIDDFLAYIGGFLATLFTGIGFGLGVFKKV